MCGPIHMKIPYLSLITVRKLLSLLSSKLHKSHHQKVKFSGFTVQDKLEHTFGYTAHYHKSYFTVLSRNLLLNSKFI